MKLLVHAPEILAIDVRVDLRRRNVDVSEHLLDGAQIGAALEQVRREGVTQRVRRDGLRDAGLIDVLAENLPGAHAREWLAARVQKENSLPLSLLERRAELAQVDRDRADRLSADRNEPLLGFLCRRRARDDPRA